MKRFFITPLIVVFCVLFLPPAVLAQTKPFVPLEFEYPETVLTTPKTYVYKNTVTGAFRYKDISLQKRGTDVVVAWKEYDPSPIADSSIEINDKTLDLYMLMNGQAIKAAISEDSVHQEDSGPGEKVQTFYFNLNETISLFTSVHSFFLKDTSVNWQGKSVSCMVVQSFNRQKLTNALVPDKPKEISGIVYYYFGKDIGLLMYRSEMDKERTTWQLVEIREKKP